MPTKKPRSKKMSKDNIDLLLDHGLDLDNRSIWLGNAIKDEADESGIDHNLMERFVRSMSVLNRANNQPITVYLMTEGGDEFAGAGMYDCIKASKSPVDVIVIGKCMSMGVVILQAARTRIMMENSVLMTHVGNMSQSGHKNDVVRWVDFYTNKYDPQLDALVYPRMKASNNSLTKAAYDKMNEFDTILTAKEAIELGFADRLFDPKKDKL